MDETLNAFITLFFIIAFVMTFKYWRPWKYFEEESPDSDELYDSLMDNDTTRPNQNVHKFRKR